MEEQIEKLLASFMAKQEQQRQEEQDRLQKILEQQKEERKQEEQDRLQKILEQQETNQQDRLQKILEQQKEERSKEQSMLQGWIKELFGTQSSKLNKLENEIEGVRVDMENEVG